MPLFYFIPFDGAVGSRTPWLVVTVALVCTPRFRLSGPHRQPHARGSTPVRPAFAPAPRSYFLFSLQLRPPFGVFDPPPSLQGRPFPVRSPALSGEPTLEPALLFLTSRLLSLRSQALPAAAAHPLPCCSPSPCRLLHPSFPTASLEARADCCLVSRCLCGPPPLSSRCFTWTVVLNVRSCCLTGRWCVLSSPFRSAAFRAVSPSFLLCLLHSFLPLLSPLPQYLHLLS